MIRIASENMATSSGNGEELMSCPICLETLKNPKYLPCLHTFCEGCILIYITSGFEKENKQYIECPVCRSIAHAPRENCTEEEWANLLPVNFLFVGLMEKEKVQRPERQCMSCERQNKQSDAVYICVECSDTLCKFCCECHKSNKFTSEHDIKAISDVSSDEQFPNVFKNKCSEHVSKKIKLFCVDHDTPCCSMCVSITHRKCENIVTIEDAAKLFSSSKAIENITKQLDDSSEDFKTIHSRFKEMLSNLEKEHTTKLNKLKNQCKKLISKVEDFESVRKSELHKRFEEKKGEIETSMVIFENRLKAINNEKEILKVSLDKAPDVQVMFEARKISHKQEEHRKLIHDNVGKCNVEYKFELHNIENLIESVQKMESACKVSCDEFEASTVITLRSSIISPKSYECVRFQTIRRGWWMNNDDSNAVSFEVSKEIFLAGFLSYSVATVACHITITLMQGDTTLVEISSTLETKNAKNNLLTVELQKPLKLSANTKYDVILKANQSQNVTFYYGQNGKSDVECEGVIFKFSNSSLQVNSSTTLIEGQIPGFVFRKLTG